MKALRTIVCVSALVTLSWSATSIAYSATFYVRKNGPADFTTIQACVNAMSGGDICIVGAGVYEERIQFPEGKSGSASAPTIVKADKTGSAIIRGIDTANCNYLRIEGFEISASGETTPGISVNSSNVQIANNHFHDLHQAIAGTGNDITIQNNLIVSPALGAISLNDVRATKIYNNTVVNPVTSGIRITGDSSAEVKNNILYSDRRETGNTSITDLMYSADATSTIQSGSNLLYVASKTLNQDQFPKDIVNKDPIFVSLVSKNYRIRPGSPGINAGLTLSGFNNDLNGTQRPQGPAWDIGAYEFPANATRPAPPGSLRLTVQ